MSATRLLTILAVFLGLAGGIAVQSQDDMVLTVWQHEFPPLQDAFTDKWIPEFEAANPGVTIELTSIPFAGVISYDAKLLSALAGGDGPDLWDMGDWNYRTYLDAGFLAPLNPTLFGYDDAADMIDSHAPGSMSVFVEDGQVYGVFSEHNTLGLFYNVALFEEVGIGRLPTDRPSSWDEIADIAAALYKENPDTGAIERVGYQFGFFSNFRSPQWYAQGYYALLRQFGQNDLYVDGAAAANTPAAVNAFQVIHDYTWTHKAYDPGFIANWFADIPQGRVGMVLAGTWFPPAATPNNPDWEFAVAPHPVVDPEDPATYHNIQWAWGWSVNANVSSERQQLAQEFLAFIVGKKGETEQAAWWFENLGYTHPSKAFLASDAYAAKLESDPWLRVWVDAFEDYQIEYIQHMYDQAGQALLRAIDRIIYDQMSAEDTANLLQGELERLQ